MTRRLNLRFLTVLLAVVAVSGVFMHLAHGIQVQRNASALLDRARRAEVSDDHANAEQLLSEYLNIRREDGAAWEWYARVVDQQKSDRHQLDRVFLVHEQALRYNPGNTTLERRCAELALEMGRYSDAQRLLKNLDEAVPRDSRGHPADTDRAALAELEDLLGQCDVGQTRFDEAERFFNQAIEHDPGRVSCYDRLARLRRSELRRDQAADGADQGNGGEKSQGRSLYLYRWRYKREFSPPADDRRPSEGPGAGPR